MLDSRPGKKCSRAGRKRKDKRKGRPGRGALKEKSRMDEPELINKPEIAVLPTCNQFRGVRAIENVVEDDPMLPEEVIEPLIVNELAEDAMVFVDHMVNEIKI